MTPKPKLTARQRWLRRLAFYGSLYALFTLAACQVAPALLFHPEFGRRMQPKGELSLPMPDGTEIKALYLPNPSAAFTLWYFHGNAEDLWDIEPTLHALHDAGYAVFAADYPGYGRSGGQPTEQSVYAASRVARAYLRDTLKIPAKQTIILGRSLGGGPAVQMATEERVAGLVLQSTFLSSYRVMTHWTILPGAPFNNASKLPRVGCPVLVQHGRLDEVIGFYHGEQLFALAPEPKRFLWVDSAGHNDLPEVSGANYWQALKDFTVLCAAQR